MLAGIERALYIGTLMTVEPSLPSLSFLEAERSMPLLKLPLRTTVVELPAARILVSPASTLSVETLRSAGAITDIVAPNLFHLEGVPAAVEAHPTARLWGPEGAPKKLAATWGGILGRDPWPHHDALAHIELAGMPGVQEHVFWHRASRALIVTDLVFNMHEVRGFGPWLILGIFGTYRRFGVSRLFLKMVKDRRAFEESLRQLAALDLEHVIPAHGAILSVDAKARLLAALRERGYSPASSPGG